MAEKNNLYQFPLELSLRAKMLFSPEQLAYNPDSLTSLVDNYLVQLRDHYHYKTLGVLHSMNLIRLEHDLLVSIKPIYDFKVSSTQDDIPFPVFSSYADVACVLKYRAKVFFNADFYVHVEDFDTV